MLLIIHLMLSLIQIPGRGNLLLFRRRLPKGEAFCGKRHALAVFPLFYQAGPPAPAGVLWSGNTDFAAAALNRLVAGDVRASAID
jgi:hypothetical protein